jgi:hypothetical protein
MGAKFNGRELGSVKFTDNRAGNTVHIGPFLPDYATDGDVWFDSDTQNNAGKNILQNINVATIVGRTINIATNSEYKDILLVTRGLTLSSDADLSLTLNNDNSSYIDAQATATTEMFKFVLVKGGITTNKFTFRFEDTQDTQGFQFGVAEGVYRNTANLITPILRAGVWQQVQSPTSIQLKISAGGFASGSILVYGVN